MTEARFPRIDPPYQVFWNWDLLYECNYRCSYCHVVKNKKERYPPVPLEQWRKIWESLFERYGTGQIRFSGGEPSIYPGFIELVRMLTEKFTVDITTNFSFDEQEFARRVPVGNVSISASYHAEYEPFERFLERLNHLWRNGAGFPTTICFVGYPQFIPVVEKYRDMAEALSLQFKISPFDGEYNGKHYPESYSDDDRRILNMPVKNEENARTNKAWLDYKLHPENRQKVICRMGQTYAKIYPDGRVTRCCHPNSGDMGNITSPDFSLFNEPQPCICDPAGGGACPCFKAMVVGRESSWFSLWGTLEHTIHKRIKSSL